jgi:hypothetical protein
MSTRCHIIIEDPEWRISTIIYRHSDGYPQGENGVLATLVPFVQRFVHYRGWDPCYLPAQLLAHMIVKDREHLRKFYQERVEEMKPGDLRDYYQREVDNVENNFLGYGISPEMHGDTDFVYVITQDAITVYNGNRTKALVTPKQARAMMEKGTIPKKWQPEEKAA